MEYVYIIAVLLALVMVGAVLISAGRWMMARARLATPVTAGKWQVAVKRHGNLALFGVYNVDESRWFPDAEGKRWLALHHDHAEHVARKLNDIERAKEARVFTHDAT